MTKFFELLLPKSFLRRRGKVQHLERELQRSVAGKVFIDGGACVGSITELCLEESAAIHMFEPDPSAVREIRRRGLADQDKVFLHEAALADFDGESMLYRHKNFIEISDEVIGSSSLDPSKKNVDSRNSVSVACVSLASFLAEIEQNRGIVVKLDIEGEEYKVIWDLLRTRRIHMVSRLFVEFHPSKIRFGRSQHLFTVMSLALTGTIHKFNVWP